MAYHTTMNDKLPLTEIFRLGAPTRSDRDGSTCFYCHQYLRFESHIYADPPGHAADCLWVRSGGK